jgi:Secretion system C-terminal sorting domain
MVFRIKDINLADLTEPTPPLMRIVFNLPVFYISLFILIVPVKTVAQTAPVKQWDKVFGGDEYDMLNVLIPASDGNFLLGGSSLSNVNGDKSQPSRNNTPPNYYPDYWIVKMSPGGVKVWDKTYGGAGGLEELFSIVPTSDGGALLVGISGSNASFEKTENSRGGYDYWIVRIDGNGNKLWDKTFGGNRDDFAYAGIATSDRGFLIGGSSMSDISGDKSQACYTSIYNDYWLVKVDAAGNKLWDKTLGGEFNDAVKTMAQTADGGFLLGGRSNSTATFDKTSANNSYAYDYWVVKTDASGNPQWDKSFGGVNDEEITTILTLPGGNYLLTGTTESGISGNKTAPSKGGDDFWLVKIDGTGNKLWDVAVGGNDIDQLRAAIPADDGGFIVAGTSRSGISGDKSQPMIAYEDYWVVKTDASGIKQWDKTIGAGSSDLLRAVAKTPDDGLLLGGWTSSGVSGDKTAPGRGDDDYWIVKLGVPNSITTGALTSNNLCIGSQYTISYTATGTYAAGYSFIAQLSNAAGSFTTPVNIGSIGTSNLSGNIQVTIPTNTIAGNGYRIRVVASNPATTGLDNGINLTISPPPVVQINDTSVCKGGSLTLNAPTIAGAGYVWAGPNSFNAATQQININDVSDIHAGLYNLTVTVNGCSSTKGANVTILALPPVPVITAGGPVTICQGEQVLLTASSAGGNQWYKDGTVINTATAVTYNATTSGIYTVKTTNGSCTSPASSGMAITVNPFPATPTITVAANVLTSSSATGNQWYLDGTAIGGATGQTYTALAAGGYTVRVTQNGCTTASVVSNFTVTAIVDPSAWNGEVTAYPNPVIQTLFIRNDGQRQLHWQLVDVSGRKVRESVLFARSGTIDMKGMAGGIYHLVLTDNRKKQTISLTIVKQ